MEIGERIGRLTYALQAIPRTAALSVVGPAVLLIFGYCFWSFWGAKAIDQKYYGLQADKIRMTPQPVWIRSNIVQEVHAGSLKGVTLLDQNAASRIAQAFNLHPWIRHTSRVTKLAGGEVQVDVEYRQPVALVFLDPHVTVERKKVDGRTPAESTSTKSDGWKYLPLDRDGVILPHNEPEEYPVREYLSVYAKGAATSSWVGQPFGDSRIHDAVKLCALLNPLRRELKLFRIYVQELPTSSGKKDFVLEVASHKPDLRDDRRLIWGHAPGAEVMGELDLKSKLQKLYSFFSTDDTKLDKIDISGLNLPSY